METCCIILATQSSTSNTENIVVQSHPFYLLEFSMKMIVEPLLLNISLIPRTVKDPKKMSSQFCISIREAIQFRGIRLLWVCFNKHVAWFLSYILINLNVCALLFSTVLAAYGCVCVCVCLCISCIMHMRFMRIRSFAGPKT